MTKIWQSMLNYYFIKRLIFSKDSLYNSNKYPKLIKNGKIINLIN